MTERVVIYISPPLSHHAPWRVRADERPVRELKTEKDAITYAGDVARMVENAGGEVMIKIEKPNGDWEVFRV
ncbi:hypothetical protein L2Y94_08885 [Luteibacter aegosomatis]|uniref:hypothetical protein n=1 Tax=Luteibacter aegosomatis TaxID=2911537 RepID=UPI001FFA748A|nr:hypothetical protein [Luteibacter aegosomatis]UPG87450.1 hypothetical protein L2Y94_08885 [Luteibacter aegosomatis]